MSYSKLEHFSTRINQTYSSIVSPRKMNKIVGTTVYAIMTIATAHGLQFESGPVSEDPVALTMMAEAGYERRLQSHESATGATGSAAPSPDPHEGHDHGPSPAGGVSAASHLQTGAACLAITAASAAYML
jgi:hypothetical protein